MAHVVLKDLVKDYGGFKAVDNVSLTVNDGASHVGTSNPFMVIPRALGLAVPGDARENDGALEALLTVSPAPVADLEVTLTNSGPARLSFPATVIVPAGQTSLLVPVTILDNALLDGPAMRINSLWSLVFVLAGCSSPTSDKLKTSGITAHLQVTAKADGQSDATATLNVGSSLIDFVELASGDTLTASTGDDSKALTKTKLLGIVTYGATFTGHTDGGTSYGFDLQRASDLSAPSSTFTLEWPQYLKVHQA